MLGGQDVARKYGTRCVFVRPLRMLSFFMQLLLVGRLREDGKDLGSDLQRSSGGAFRGYRETLKERGCDRG